MALDSRRASWSATLGSKICWANQGELEILDVGDGERPVVTGKLTLDNVKGYPQVVGEHRLAILEVYDDVRMGVVFVDVREQPERVGGFFKDHIVRAWAMLETDLYVVVRSAKKIGGERRYRTVLALHRERPILDRNRSSCH